MNQAKIQNKSYGDYDFDKDPESRTQINKIFTKLMTLYLEFGIKSKNNKPTKNYCAPLILCLEDLQ